MNYIKHLSGFFDKVLQDDRLNPTHISLYVSLFQFWNVQRFKNPISISRDEVMLVSKIYSKATYHKCMKELHSYSYLHYDPSYNPFRGSLVTLFNFEQVNEPVQKKVRSRTKNQTSSELVLNKQRTGTEQVVNKHCTSTEQALVPSINNTNILNNINVLNNSNVTNLFEQAQKKNPELIFEKEKKEKEKLRKKKKNSPATLTGVEGPPILETLKTHFTQNQWPILEAEKFFNHFESNGWLVGGRSKMKNWKAASRNWMLNSNKFNGTLPIPLNATTGKDYSEPL